MKTIILAARDSISESNFDGFLYPIHGKPCIDYVLDEHTASGGCIIVIEKKDMALAQHIRWSYYRNVLTV